MADFHPLETQNPYPQVVGLTLDLISQPDTDAWTIKAQLRRPGQWLSLLSGQIKVGVRAATLQLTGKGGTLTDTTDRPPDIDRGYHSPSEGRWHIHFPDTPEPLLLALGRLTATASVSPWQATLTIQPQDVAIAEGQGLWPPDLSPNKLVIADRLIAHFLVHDWFAPAVSWSQWALGATPAWQPLYPLPDAEDLRQKEAILGDHLKELIQTTESDLIVLAQAVALDPQRDLAGGKFVGANLSGIDLNGANLAGSNFRGAILTDADLSGANLAGSNFRGADLSGAYLEGANLTQGDLRKSSLALANLIGADLTGANLQGTTLNSANFSAANLSQTQLGDNPGLTAEQQTKLIEQGAKFSPEPAQEMLS